MATTTFERLFATIDGGSVLDVATGTGGFISTLESTLASYDEVTGIDSSDRFADAFAATFAGKPIRYRQMDAASLDFPDNRFDTVCIANSLHHMVDPAAVLREMSRVLKPDGRMIISEMYRDGQSDAQLTHVYLHHWWAAIDTALGICHNETYSRSELVTLAYDTGIAGWQLGDVAYTDGDPHDEAVLGQLDRAIDMYIARAAPLPDGEQQSRRGEELRKRLKQVGFHGATALVAIGTKARVVPD